MKGTGVQRQHIYLAYLGLPFFLFNAFWLELWFGLPVLVALAIAFWFSTSHEPSARSRFRETSHVEFGVAVLLAALFTLFAGYFGLVFGWTPDWNDLRSDLLSTIRHFSWPVDLNTVGGAKQYLLSTPGLYLVPAGFAKVLGASNQWTQFLLAMWVVTGLVLVITFVMSRVSKVRDRFFVGLCFLFFSGLDSIGALLMQERPWAYLTSGGHLEPWSGTLQFSSVTTLLFWVPHHALSSWLGIAVLIESRKTRLFWSAAITVLLFSSVWSSFAPIGVGLVALALAALDKGFDLRSIARTVPLGIIALIGVIPIYSYYAKQDWIPREIWWYFSERAFLNYGIEDQGPAQIIWNYLLFMFLEVGVWIGIGMWTKAGRRSELWSVGILLFAVSQVVSYGPNDFAMRVSIAPLFFLFTLIAEDLTRNLMNSPLRLKRAVLVIVVLLSSWTGVTEVAENYRRGPRALAEPCVLGGCDSSLTPLVEGYSFTSQRPMFFRD